MSDAHWLRYAAITRTLEDLAKACRTAETTRRQMFEAIITARDAGATQADTAQVLQVSLRTARRWEEQARRDRPRATRPPGFYPS